MVRSALTATELTDLEASFSDRPPTVMELARRWRSGDTAAGDAIHNRYATTVERIVALHLNPRFRSRVDVTDVCQIVFLHVFARLRDADFELDDASFARWLGGLARNQTIKQIDRLTAACRDINRDVPERFDMPLDAFIHERRRESAAAPPDAAVASRENLKLAISHLDEDCRQIVLMLDLGERSRERLAAAIGRTERTVRRNLIKIRSTLEPFVAG